MLGTSTIIVITAIMVEILHELAALVPQGGCNDGNDEGCRVPSHGEIIHVTYSAHLRGGSVDCV
jgi:hypothetical protein